MGGTAFGGGPFKGILFYLGYKQVPPILGNAHTSRVLRFRDCCRTRKSNGFGLRGFRCHERQSARKPSRPKTLRKKRVHPLFAFS